jgi:methionyl-tRNA formyltransferase
MARLNGVVILAARTARSRAYLQTLAAAGLGADVLIYGPADMEQVTAATPRAHASHCGELLLPDFDRSLIDSAHGDDWRISECPELALDAPAILAAIAAFEPRLLVFSGYPAQRVPAALIARWPVLHVHGGALPDYRGSTTVYYSMLNNRRPEVTGILVDGEIDTGNVVDRRIFPMPPADVDIDYVYDSAMRADLLCHCLQHWQAHGRLPDTQTQDGEGHSYYIIHPLLKRIALLGRHTLAGEKP